MQSSSKRIIMFTLFFMLAASIITVQPVNATAKIKLSKKRLTLKVGKSTKLKLKKGKKVLKTVKWSSTKRTVATVNNKGKVVAVKKGTAVINAKYKKKTYKCKVVVKEASTTSSISSSTSESEVDSEKAIVIFKPASRSAIHRVYYDFSWSDGLSRSYSPTSYTEGINWSCGISGGLWASDGSTDKSVMPSDAEGPVLMYRIECKNDSYVNVTYKVYEGEGSTSGTLLGNGTLYAGQLSKGDVINSSTTIDLGHYLYLYKRTFTVVVQYA